MNDLNQANAAPATQPSTAQAPAFPVPYAFAAIPKDTFIMGADLTNEATQAESVAALQQAYADATAGVPPANILDDWPKDAEGDLLITGDLDYHILARTSGTYGKSSDGDPARHCVHLLATPSVDALRATEKGLDFIQDSIVSALKRRAAAVMGSYLKAREYALPGSLGEWISGRETASSDNAARGSVKLFNAIRADVAKTIRDGLKAKITASDLRGVLASRAAMADRFGLHDKPEVEEKLAAKLFEITRSQMLARAIADVAAWNAIPADAQDRPEAAPWPVDAASGQPTAESLALFMKPLAIWERDRAEAVEEAPELDLSDLDSLG